MEDLTLSSKARSTENPEQKNTNCSNLLDRKPLQPDSLSRDPLGQSKCKTMNYNFVLLLQPAVTLQAY